MYIDIVNILLRNDVNRRFLYLLLNTFQNSFSWLPIVKQRNAADWMEVESVRLRC